MIVLVKDNVVDVVYDDVMDVIVVIDEHGLDGDGVGGHPDGPLLSNTALSTP